jgi:hypothetical protein
MWDKTTQQRTNETRTHFYETLKMKISVEDYIIVIKNYIFM